MSLLCTRFDDCNFDVIEKETHNHDRGEYNAIDASKING